MKLLVMVLAVLVAHGCSSTYKVKQEASENSILTQIPEWYIDSEEQRGIFDRKNKHKYIYGVGTAVSSNLQLAIEKATIIAKADLADQIAGQINKDTSYQVVEEGSEASDNVAMTTDSLVKNVVKQIAPVGYEEWNKAVLLTATSQYRAYIGLKWTRGDKNQLNDLISNDLYGGVAVVPEIIEVENLSE